LHFLEPICVAGITEEHETTGKSVLVKEMDTGDKSLRKNHLEFQSKVACSKDRQQQKN
jgi:hypothetical protein